MRSLNNLIWTKNKKKIIKKFVKLIKIKKLNFFAKATNNFTVLYASRTIWTISKIKCLLAKTI